MSEQSARDWFNGTEKAEISIAQLVKEIKAYVESKPDDYRLLFMADEVGQYIGTDTDMLLNFQSLTEKLGSECYGKVWVMATGQEALDQVVKVRQDEFSRIMARFKTRLSLSSSSVDEVIQRRILAKNNEAKGVLAKRSRRTAPRSTISSCSRTPPLTSRASPLKKPSRQTTHSSPISSFCCRSLLRSPQARQHGQAPRWR